MLRREGNRVYLAGNNDLSHYFAVAELLRRWGCRWYMPTEFGECIPERRDLKIGDLDYAYSSPFEIRSYWISWLGDNSGAAEFRMRNMMTGRRDMPPTGHALGKYTKGLGQGTFHFPITDPKTARHVAQQVEKTYADGGAFSLGMEDGISGETAPVGAVIGDHRFDRHLGDDLPGLHADLQEGAAVRRSAGSRGRGVRRQRGDRSGSLGQGET